MLFLYSFLKIINAKKIINASFLLATIARA